MRAPHACAWEDCESTAFYEDAGEWFCSIHHPAGRLHIEQFQSQNAHLRRLLRDVGDVLRAASKHQPRYNGRPSCPVCANFVDDEETHQPDCPLVAASNRISYELRGEVEYV